jgi:sugar phosphate isomerase/epimerase
MDVYEGMKVVRDMGVTGLHLSVGGGPFHPDKLDKGAREKLVKHVASLGLEVSAVSSWGGNVHLENPATMESSMADAKKALELAADLRCGIWQAHIGVVPRDEKNPGWATTVEACKRIAEHGEKVGACLAIETGPEPPVVLKRLIETVGGKAIRVNYDPANLVLWPAAFCEREKRPYNKEEALRDFQPVEGVKVIGKYVVHTHAKDALVHPKGKRQEVPLGQGWIDWPRYVGLLREAGFNGYYAIEREVGADPVGDIRKAVAFLKTL